MGPTPLAFSVHNFISSVGADAGFAAIIGLAILVLLYFAHARETANLREEAGLLAARLQQAEARVAELSRPQPVAVPAPEAVQVTDQRAAVFPFAPAGMGAPALADATRVVPLPDPAPPEDDEAAAVQPAVAMAAAPVASASPAPAAVPSPPPLAAPPPAFAPSPLSSAPSPLSSAPPPAIPRPATAAGANGGGRPGASLPNSAASGQGPAATNRPSLGGQLPPLDAPASRRGGSRVGRILMALIALLLVAAVAVALIILTSSTNSSTNSPGQASTTNAPAAAKSAAFVPSAVTVAVLNGTSTNQLAHRVAAKLTTDGYREGRVATAANQTEAKTVVAYLPGAKNRRDALHVATSLHLRASAVQAIDQGTQEVACPPPGACGANVVVTVGADLATL